MNILFVHQNFPGQFRALAPALVARGDRVVAMTMNDAPAQAGIEVVRSRVGHRVDGRSWGADFEAKIVRGQATLQSAVELAARGFTPDVIVAHPAWGESLFLKQLWPAARLGIYCEYFYAAEGADVGFDPEFPVGDPLEQACRTDVRNICQRLHFDMADAALSPTRWQAGTYPRPFRDGIEVIHDGVDTQRFRPDPDASVRIGETLRLDRSAEVMTFVARDLEPYRGYHVLMRALPELLARRPGLRVVIAGGNGTGYGSAPPAGDSWMSHYYGEVRDRIDVSRVHFLGRIPHAGYRALLQLSTVHLYLTYPFVLSWSLVEAMATGCAIVASDTPPVREVVEDGVSGLLFPFFDTGALVDRACALLDAPAERARLGATARARMIADYDLGTVCLPAQLAWVDRLASYDRTDASTQRPTA